MDVHKIQGKKERNEIILQAYTGHMLHQSMYLLQLYLMGSTGYSNFPATKDCVHSRRHCGWNVAKVQFDESMQLQTKKDEFLANQTNKTKIHLYCPRHD